MPPLLKVICLLTPVWTVADLTFDAVLGRDEEDRTDCPEGYEPIMNEMECRVAMTMLPRADPDKYNGVRDDALNRPQGCYFCLRSAKQRFTGHPTQGCKNKEGVWFNTHPEGSDEHYEGVRRVCKRTGWEIEPHGTLIIGDGTMDRWNDPDLALNHSYNLGIAGMSCADIYQELPQLLQRFMPDYVVLNCGPQDMKHYSADIAHHRWKKIAEKVTRAGATLITLGSILPRFNQEMHSEFKRYDRLVRGTTAERVLRDHAALIFNEVSTAFESMGNPRELYEGGVLSREGYEAVYEWVTTAIDDPLPCVIYAGNVCMMQSPSFPVEIFIHPQDNADCPSNEHGTDWEIQEARQCRLASGLVRGQFPAALHWRGEENDPMAPHGCYFCPGGQGCVPGTYFNHHPGDQNAHNNHRYCVRPHHHDHDP